jgi:bisphosphoglycerate-independent phosphoglycerate mutase (AlkP superfamily)
MTADNPGIEDLAPTALSLFGIAAPAWMEGRAVVGGGGVSQ